MNNITSDGGGGVSGASISGVAYSGGPMKLPGWRHPVIVDLAGMRVPGPVPLLANHDNTTSARLGLVEARIADHALFISGGIVSGTSDAAGIVRQGKAGADWQLSIGADVVRFHVARSAVAVNGRRFEAPVYVIDESVLREVSVVAVGADAATNMKVAARFRLADAEPDAEPDGSADAFAPDTAGGAVFARDNSATVLIAGPTEHADLAANPNFPPNNISNNNQTERIHDIMNTENTISAAGSHSGTTIPAGAANANRAAITDTPADSPADAVARERARITAIRGICAGEFDDIESQAIADGSAPDTVASRVLSAIRSGRPGADLGIRVKSKPEGIAARATLGATLALRAGIDPDELAKTCGERTVDAAMSDIGMSLKQFIVECLRADGIACGRSFDNDTIRSAFSSVTLPGILSDVANKKLLQAYRAQPVIATKLCAAADLADFKEHERFRLTDVGDLELVAPDGQIKDGGLIESVAKNQLDTYGKKFCLTRKMILNDDLGAFMKVPAAMGNRAARLIDQLFFRRLLANPAQSDGNNLFCSEHGNLLSGTDSALSAAALTRGIEKFLNQTDPDGQPINLEPRYLLVPTALKHTAIGLTKGATLIMSGGSDTEIRPALNVLADENLRVLSSPYLGNASYTGHSDTAWYLFADPDTADTWEIGYLRGKRTPTVERGETDFNSLGIWFRVYFDLGIREQDHRGMLKANGAA